MSDLVKRLRWRRFPPDTKLSEDIRALGLMCDEAAARIEALEAEVQRLREALATFRDYGCPVCRGDCASANPPVSCCPMQMARAAMEPTND